MADDGLGYRRIHRELHKENIEIGLSTVNKIVYSVRRAPPHHYELVDDGSEEAKEEDREEGAS